MSRTNRWWLLCAIGLSGSLPAAQPLGCLIEPQQVAEVGTPVIGVVEELRVERGEPVLKGQILALLRGEVERASVGVASSRAQAEADVHGARANLSFARQKLDRAQDLLTKHFISQQGLDQARAEFEVAQQKLAQALEQRRIARNELGLAAAQLAQRSIRSPFDGVVAERYVSVGERVDEKPLFRLAKVDPLKVQVVVPAALYGKILSGARARVQPQLPQASAVSAQVTRVDQIIDAPSNTFRVQLALPNPDLALPAGLRCEVDFGLAAPAKQARPPSTQPNEIRPASLKLPALPSALSAPRPTSAY